MRTWAEVKNDISKNEKYVLFFMADWYSPCEIVQKWFDELTIPKEKFNVDESIELIEKFKIVEVPTVVVFENNQVIHRIPNFELRNLPDFNYLLEPKLEE